jgi:hypothetical protein
LNTTPTAENTLRTDPPHTGHSVAFGSLKDCTSSNWLAHPVSVHRY